MNRSFREPLVETSARRQAGAKLSSAGRKALRLYRRIEARGSASVKRDAAALLAMLPR
jgi:molybdenum-dependent DNA-binding transcriptional regulator ModE